MKTEKQTSNKTSKRGRKLYYFLDRLSKEELRGFRKYLRSPLFGASPQFESILNIFLKEVKGKGQAAITAQRFLREWFPDETFTPEKEKYVWIRLINFQKALLNFIALQKYLEDPFAQSKYLLESAVERGWEKYLPELYRRGKAALPEKQNSAGKRMELELEILWSDYLSDRTTSVKEIHLEEVLESMDNSFVIQKLKYACAAKVGELFFGEPFEIRLLQPVLALFEAESLPKPPLSLPYYQAFQMLDTELNAAGNPDGHYQELRAFLKPPFQYGREDALDLFGLAQNFCILRYHQGSEGYLEELKSLYDDMAESGVLFQHGLISRRMFKNIINIMGRFGAFDFAFQFIEENRSRIADNLEGLAYTYNLSVLRFYQQEYDQVVELLYNEIGQFMDVFYGLGARIYLCRSLWELEKLEWLEYSLEAFRQYLRRIPEVQAQDTSDHQKFVRYLARMSRAKQESPDRILLAFKKVKAQVETAGDEGKYPWIFQTILKELAKSR